MKHATITFDRKDRSPRRNCGPRRIYHALLFLAAVWAAPTVGMAQTFSNPVQLSLNANASSASTAIDAAGESFAVWSDNGSYFSLHRAETGWSAPALLASAVLPGGAPMLKTTSGGAATIVSYRSSDGIWATDRPVGGNFGTAVKIATAPNLLNAIGKPAVQFLADSKGDQAVVYEDFANAAYRLVAIRRSAGTAVWKPAEIILTSLSYGNMTVAGAAIGETGDVLVTWETFTLRCNRYCHETSFVVHATRAAASSRVWSDSGPLTLPSTPAYATMAALDPRGRAVVLTIPPYLAVVVANTQAGSGAKWSRPQVAFKVPSPAEIFGWGAESNSVAPPDAASFAVSGITSGAASIDFIDGNLAANTWGSGMNLAAGDSSGAGGLLAFGANLSGGNIAEWTDLDGTVRAAFRQTISSSWSAAQTLAGASPCNVINLQCTVPAATAMNENGQAVLLFNRADPNDVTHTLFAVTK